MPSSFERINYNLRANKSIERKMMSEALQRLRFIDDLQAYKYVGFGSPYFADFVLFHKGLGLTDLVSIEQEESKKRRFEFNIPYSGIQMKFGHSSTILPNLELGNKKSIVWLDYDDRLTDFMFGDIDTFFLNALPGSVFIISLNVEEEYLGLKPDESDIKLSLKNFRQNKAFDRIGKERYPNEFLGINLNTKNNILLSYELISRQINSALISRNGDNYKKVFYKQIFNFTYSDNASILTVGGIIYDNTQFAKIGRMRFDSLPFIRADKESYKINCPNLTFREIKALDKILPSRLDIGGDGRFVNRKFQEIPLIPTDIKNYAEIYRYYPNFTEANL